MTDKASGKRPSTSPTSLLVPAGGIGVAWAEDGTCRRDEKIVSAPGLVDPGTESRGSYDRNLHGTVLTFPRADLPSKPAAPRSGARLYTHSLSTGCHHD